MALAKVNTDTMFHGDLLTHIVLAHDMSGDVVIGAPWTLP